MYVVLETVFMHKKQSLVFVFCFCSVNGFDEHLKHWMLCFIYFLSNDLCQFKCNYPLEKKKTFLKDFVIQKMIILWLFESMNINQVIFKSLLYSYCYYIFTCLKASDNHCEPSHKMWYQIVLNGRFFH